ncbi:hypothetical protein [Cerasicoccus fimbriatus]|uniref:hypothetical protein n=1 Tax=Cerasicoccus fimbriatus TaxID=3014554 RepID=UPI0022B3876B|nr:hypothetical protein [Cerasicoccus sp. TK19100]
MLIKHFALSLSLALFVLTGCESTDPGSGSSSSEPMGNNFSGHVAVLPSEVLSYLPQNYAYICPMVNEATADELIQEGYLVAPEDLVANALAANGESLRRQIQSSDPKVMAKGVSDLIWKLNDETKVEMLIVPQILEQSVTLKSPYNGHSWGGVSREFHVNGDRGGEQILQVDTASVIMGAYNKFGQAVYFGQGGMDFLENATRAGDHLYLSPKLSGQIPTVYVQDAVAKALARWQMEAPVSMSGRDYQR